MIITPYIKSPKNDSNRIIKGFLKEDRGLFFYFRHMCLRMQKHFMELFDHKDIPIVFLHGNPHIENYVINDQGCGMVDFDRSRMGPYTWDIVRFLCSLAFKSEKSDSEFFISPVVSEYFKEGYYRGFLNPEISYKEISKTTEKADFKVWYESTERYLEANVKWTKVLKNSSLAKKDRKKLENVFKAYLVSREELSFLEKYDIIDTGQGIGTFGKKRWIIALKPKNSKSDKDNLLIEIKEVYEDPDNKYYFNPFDHHGKRMIKASELYAPGIEQGLGFCTYKDQQYWGRYLPHKNAKIKDDLTEFEQVDFAYSVGTQIGRAHRISLSKEYHPEQVMENLESNYNALIRLGMIMNKGVFEAYKKYIAKVK